MKSVLLIACALFYAFFPALAEIQHPVFIPLLPIVLGMVYFAFHRHEWGSLLPWMLACIAVGRITAYWWMNVRRGRAGPLVDGDVWVAGGLAVLFFAYRCWKWLRREIPARPSVD